MLGWRASSKESLCLCFDLKLREARINPLSIFDSVSCVQTASYNHSISTQWGWYLNRAVSSKSTLFSSLLNPPIGTKCPSPDYFKALREVLQITWSPWIYDVAVIAVLNRLKSSGCTKASAAFRHGMNSCSGVSSMRRQHSSKEWTCPEFEWGIVSLLIKLCFNGLWFGLKVIVCRPLQRASYVNCSRVRPFCISS